EVVGCDRNTPKCDAFTEATRFLAQPDWKKAVGEAEIVLLSVRTNQVSPWLEEARNLLKSSQSVVCLSAGISLSRLRESVDSSVQMHRAITSINVAVGAGTTVLLREAMGTASDRVRGIEEMFAALGEVVIANSDK